MRTLPYSKTVHILQIILEAHDQGRAPSLRELARLVGYSSATSIRPHLAVLQGAGLITYQYHRHRSIKPTRLALQTRRITKATCTENTEP